MVGLIPRRHLDAGYSTIAVVISAVANSNSSCELANCSAVSIMMTRVIPRPWHGVTPTGRAESNLSRR